MRRLKATTKREKCKYKRCTYKRVDNERYCAKHVDKALSPSTATVSSDGIMEILEKYQAPSLLQRIKSFIWIDK
jgi:hypothetical protein